MDPFSLATGVVGLVTVALQLVTGALGMIDTTVAAHNEAADELKKLQDDLEDLEAQMNDIHATLQVLASNTKDRAFKKLLRNEHSNTAIAKLCTALDETFVLLARLTDQIKAQESRLHSLALPDDTRSLAFVRAILKHNLAPSKTSHLVKSLRDMRAEIQMCLRKLETAFQHPWRLYTAMSNGLARVATNETTFSTSTTLTTRIRLVGWLKDREGLWGISRLRNGVMTIKQVINGVHPAPNSPISNEREEPEPANNPPRVGRHVNEDAGWISVDSSNNLREEKQPTAPPSLATFTPFEYIFDTVDVRKSSDVPEVDSAAAPARSPSGIAKTIPNDEGVLIPVDEDISVAYAHPGATSSAPVLPSILKRSAAIAKTPSAPGLGKKVSFAENPTIYDIFSADVYDRRSESSSTFQRLTPSLAQSIKEELNSFKMEEMEVHPASRIYTHFFI